MNEIFVPNINDHHLNQLLNLIDPTHDPIIVNVQPEPGSEENDCFQIIREKVKRDGGKCVYGWQVWKTTDIIEAEAHAVWENQAGELIDLTPKEFSEILFIEDENMNYEDKQIDSVRLNISKNPLADDLIMVNREKYLFGNRGERAKHLNLMPLLNDHQIEYWNYLHFLQGLIGQMLLEGKKRSSPCVCGSQKKYSECHGKNLQQLIGSIK